MKMLFTKAVLFFSLIALESKAQWSSTPPLISTLDDVTIQSNLVQGSLTIQRTDVIQNLGGTTYTYPKPAISILQTRPNLPTAAIFGMTATNAPQNIFEIVGSTYTNGSGGTNNGTFTGYKSPIFVIDEFGRMQVGGIHKSNYNNSIYGTSFFDGHSLFKGKMRLSNNVASITAFDWSNTGFLYTLSVDNCNSRFLGDIEIGNQTNLRTLTINGDLIIKGNNINTTGDNEIKLLSDGNIRAREILVDFDNIPDYVFKTGYNLMPLKELEQFIFKNNHLPKIKSEEEYKQTKGISLGELNLKLLEKVEELTLYLIQQQKEINELKNQLKTSK
jgi:hypothetical protein